MSDIEHMQETQEFRVPMRTAATSNWAKDGKRLVALIGKDDALYLGDEDAYHTKVENGNLVAYYDNQNGDLFHVTNDSSFFYDLYLDGSVLSFEDEFHNTRMGRGYDYLRKVCNVFDTLKVEGFEEKSIPSIGGVPLTRENLEQAHERYLASDLYKGTVLLTEMFQTVNLKKQKEACDKLLHDGLRAALKSRKAKPNLDNIAAHLIAGASAKPADRGLAFPYDTQRAAALALASLPEGTKPTKADVQKLLVEDIQKAPKPEDIPNYNQWAVEKLQSYFKIADTRHILKEIDHRTEFCDFDGLRKLQTKTKSSVFR